MGTADSMGVIVTTLAAIGLLGLISLLDSEVARIVLCSVVVLAFIAETRRHSDDPSMLDRWKARRR